MTKKLGGEARDRQRQRLLTPCSVCALLVGALLLLVTKPASSATPPSLRGTYTHKFSLSDFGRAGIDRNYLCPCVWTMRIGAHTLTLQTTNQNPTESLTIRGTRLLVKDKPGSYGRMCATNATGIYTWRIAKSGLNLTEVKDSCGDRAAVLGHPGWRRR